MNFYGLSVYYGAGWLELKNQLIGLGGVVYLSILILGGVGYGTGYHPLISRVTAYGLISLRGLVSPD